MSHSARWWESFFDRAYADHLLRPRDEARLDSILDVILRMADLGPGSVLFDQCCGVGRLSIPLARRGLRIIGVELSKDYVDDADAAARAESLPCSFHQADAYSFVTPDSCDAAINWFSSWGYHDDDRVNLKMLERAYESLRPGGCFLLELYSVTSAIARFQASMIERPSATEADGIIVLIETQPDFVNGMMRSVWTWMYPDGRRDSRHVATRMMLPDQIIRLLNEAGFRNVELFDEGGGAFSLRSSRCLFRAMRPA